MNATAKTTEFCTIPHTAKTFLTGPFETLIREHRETAAMKEGIILWHYVPRLLWQRIEGQMDEFGAAALRVACRNQVRIILRDKLPDWLLLGTSQGANHAPAGSLFCMIVYGEAREKDAQVWMEEIFMRMIAPRLSAVLLDTLTTGDTHS